MIDVRTLIGEGDCWGCGALPHNFALLSVEISSGGADGAKERLAAGSWFACLCNRLRPCVQLAPASKYESSPGKSCKVATADASADAQCSMYALVRQGG